MKKPVFNRTKIVGTIGPASADRNILKQLIELGLDVCRINAAHGNHGFHEQIIHNVRSINMDLGSHICLLYDLQGPKIRIDEVENNEIEIASDSIIEISTERVLGNSQRVSINYPFLAKEVKADDLILIDDGKIQLRVLETDGSTVVKARVIVGGRLSSKKGVNLPNVQLSIPSLTEKDYQDLDFALSHNVEWIGLSFVRSAKDVKVLKEYIQRKGKESKVIAKIEKPEALNDLDAIIQAADGIMIARGDLGVEIPMEDVPMIQKNIVRKCNQAAKPVIIATQMMESMINNPRPTRAETNDVANAVLDGADAVMLSGETAMGKYPIQVIESMQRIIASVEKEEILYNRNVPLDPKSETFHSDAICYASCVLAEKVGAKAITGLTRTGYTAYQLSRHRPKAHIFIFTDNVPLLNTLNLIWGVQAFHYDGFVGTDETMHDIKQILLEKKLIQKGDVIINTASMPMLARKRTNMLKISEVD
ncbi:MAG: pyruvate kinase [Bacteroidia bacterium]|nr:pyruvate kinase [Bacteroidia bacterium]MDW8302068.1 pyruvate kinase [Bacteroidia bacterium]